MAAILKILKYQTQLQSDLRYEKIVPNYAKKSFFYGDDVIDDFRNKLQGQCLVNKCQNHNCLSRLYMPKDDLNE